MNATELNKIINATGTALCDSYEKTGDSVLVFPQYRTGDYRVSEQESRFLFAAELFSRKIPFSVETPTESLHSFTGENSISGNIDLTILNSDKTINEWVVEFKEGQKKVHNDFEKIFASTHNSLYFHLLKNSDKGTLPALVKKIRSAVSDKVKSEKSSISNNTSTTLVIAIVVLEKRELFLRDIKMTKLLNEATAQEFFDKLIAESIKI